MLADEEQSKAVNEVKLLPSVGRGMKLPPLCDVTLPQAYYDDLPPHLHMMSKLGIGRGQVLQQLVGDNTDFDCPGEKSLPANIVHEIPVCSVSDELPRLESAKREDLILPEKPASRPKAAPMSLKALAAQFTVIK